ncbi:MAG TPA: sigma-70 family RNA polymerase sigma factor [Gemmataceae bacterium]|jgi:RNA polymerase sigma factor (sigma-70 family)
MAGGQPSLILQHLRNLLRRRESGNLTDGQLLERFVRERDEAAFEVLVWRHGPMVLALGQRVLHNPHDAEDVLQATFLTLVRKAGSIGKGESLSSWLYKVAYRIALRARARAVKTIADGRAFENMPAAEETDEVAWRELRPLLDTAIERLPAKYRAAVILCDLQGKTHREAAEQLGCPIGTVSTRVKRARQLLQKRLAHHGLILPAGALGVALSRHAFAAMPAPLTASTLRAASLLRSDPSGAASILSARVVELIEGGNKAMLMSRFKIVALLALMGGAVAAGAGVMARREPPLQPPAAAPGAEKDKPSASKKPAEDAVTVRGRVLDPDGKPVKGARLYWPRVPKSEPRTSEDVENIEIAERAKSDAEGRFRFELPRSDIHPEWRNVCLLAAADGYGVDGVELPKDDPSPQVTLRLVKDQPIEGRIVSTEGKPLAGVSVRMMVVGKTRQERLDDFLAAWKRKDPRATDQAFGQLSQQMFLSRHEKSSQAVTDKDGRFRLQGAGVERMVLVRLRAPGLTPAPLLVINRAGFDPTAWNKAARDNIPPEARRPEQPPLLYGPKIEYVAPAGRRIEGTVREADSDKPVSGYRITINVPNGFDINTVSDKEGKYKLLGVPKMKEYTLFAYPPANSAWLPTVARGEDAEGLRTVQVDFTVVRGIVVNGRVLDRATGKGVRAGVRFAPLPGNKFFGKPGYDYYKYAQVEQTMTDVREAGRYQLAVMPGPGVLMSQARGLSETANGGQKMNPYKQAEFDAKDREHVKITESDDGDRSFPTALDNHSESLTIQNAVKYLDLAPDAGMAKCDLFVERGATRTIKIEDADGKPLTGTTVAGVAVLGQDTFTIKEARCTIFALDPKKPRRLFFWHAERKLAGTLILRGDEKEPVVVRLGRARAVTGRLLDRGGQPLAGADVFLNWSDPAGSQLYGGAQVRPRVRTSKDGRFRFEGIVPELKFRLGISRGETSFLGDPPIGVRQVKLGETLDLGDIRVKPAQ